VGLNEERVKERYGRLPAADQNVVEYFRALKFIASADRSFPDSERKALANGMTRLGVSDDVRKAVDSFETSGASLDKIVPKMKPGGLRARMLVRDAVELARADGTYSPKEKAAVAKAAKLVGVDQSTLQTIESLVELEHAVKRLRKALFPKKV
jgi:uncharacterized membrane protein YebE (DUF533 family)